MSTPLIIWSSENYKKSSPMPEHSWIDGKTKQFKVCRTFSDKLAAREFNLNINIKWRKKQIQKFDLIGLKFKIFALIIMNFDMI